MENSHFTANQHSTDHFCVNCKEHIKSEELLALVKSSAGERSTTKAAHFHPDCLRCTRCEVLLNESYHKCYFSNHLRVLCDLCYKRETHCANCKLRISENSRIYGLLNHVFHDECFTCSICSRHPLIGEQVICTEGQIYCSSHCELPMENVKLQWNTQKNHLVHSLLEEQPNDFNDASVQLKVNTTNHTPGESPSPMEDFILKEEMNKPLESPRQNIFSQNRKFFSIRQRSSPAGNANKSKRIRTSFTPQQISVLNAYFKTVMNPDGQQLEQIAHVTNLPKRVTQVWFQNARARQKKCGSNSTQAHQINSHQQSESTQEDFIHEFISNTPLNGTAEMSLDNDSEVRMSSPISSQLSCSLEDTSIGQFFTQGSVI